MNYSLYSLYTNYAYLISVSTNHRYKPHDQLLTTKTIKIVLQYNILVSQASYTSGPRD